MRYPISRKPQGRQGDFRPTVSIAGPKCVIGAKLGPHCRMTLKRVLPPTSSSATRSFRTPTFVKRAEDVLNLVLATIRGPPALLEIQSATP